MSFHKILIKSNFIIRTTIAKTHWSKLQKLYACTSGKMNRKCFRTIFGMRREWKPYYTLISTAVLRLQFAHFALWDWYNEMRSSKSDSSFLFFISQSPLQNFQVTPDCYYWLLSMVHYITFLRKNENNESYEMEASYCSYNISTNDTKPLWFARNQPITKYTKCRVCQFDFLCLLHWEWCQVSGCLKVNHEISQFYFHQHFDCRGRRKLQFFFYCTNRHEKTNFCGNCWKEWYLDDFTVPAVCFPILRLMVLTLTDMAVEVSKKLITVKYFWALLVVQSLLPL